MAVEITGLPPIVAQGNGEKTTTTIAQENAGQNNQTSPSVDVVTLTSQASNIKALEAGLTDALDGTRSSRATTARSPGTRGAGDDSHGDLDR